MDFILSREEEKKNGWRNRVGQFLAAYGVTVFDPWSKPQVRGLYEYGREGIDTQHIRERWTFRRGARGAIARARCSGKFRETQHIDLRMVDSSDFLIAYCPTNIYSVGTPHEIIVCRQQHKPVLFVSPPVTFPALTRLREHLRDDRIGRKLLDQLAAEVPIKSNPRGIPSLWYVPLVGGEHFFDGYGNIEIMGHRLQRWGCFGENWHRGSRRCSHNTWGSLWGIVRVVVSPAPSRTGTDRTLGGYAHGGRERGYVPMFRCWARDGLREDDAERRFFVDKYIYMYIICP
jgi:hypothetical protein